MERKEYNGWTNYETWNLALWIDNEQGSYEHWREQSKESFVDAAARWEGEERRHQAALEVMRLLKEETEENAPKLEGFYADILGAAISDVNWYEIAKNWIDEVAEEIEAAESAGTL